MFSAWTVWKMLSKPTHFLQVKQMQCKKGIQTAFVSLLTKAWCQSVFLVTLACTHTKSVHVFLSTSCYSREIRSLWLRSAGLGCSGFSQSSHLGILSAALHFTGFFSHTVLGSPQPLARLPEQAYWLTSSQTVPCSSSRASTVMPGVSVPFFHFCPCPPPTQLQQHWVC